MAFRADQINFDGATGAINIAASGSNLILTASGEVQIGSSQIAVQSGAGSADLNDYLPLTGGTISQDLIITGDLTVNGTETILNTEILNVEDNNIVVNHGGTTASAVGGGLDIEGDSAAIIYALRYNGSGYFTVGDPAGTMVRVAEYSGAGSADLDDYLPLAGGTMSGDIALGGNDITGVATINTHTVPAGTGTFALTSDIPDVTGLTGTTANIFTLDTDDDGPFGGGMIAGSGTTGRNFFAVANTADTVSGGAGDFGGVLGLTNSSAYFQLWGSTDGLQSTLVLNQGSLQLQLWDGATANTVMQVDDDGTLTIGVTDVAIFDPTGLTGPQTYTLPDATGTIALTSDLHTQNTDTGTTSDTFTVDSDNNSGNGGIIYGGSATGRGAFLVANSVDFLAGAGSGAAGAALCFGGATSAEAAIAVLVGGPDQAKATVAYDYSTPASNYFEVALWDGGGGSGAKNKVLDLSASGKLGISADGSIFGTFDPASLTLSRTYTLPDETGTLALTSISGTSANTFTIDNDDSDADGGILYGGVGAGRRLIVATNPADLGSSVGSLLSLTSTEAFLGVNTAIGSGTKASTNLKYSGSAEASNLFKVELYNIGAAASREIFKVNNDGSIQVGINNSYVKLDASGASTARTQTLQDANGTIALTSDIPDIADQIYMATATLASGTVTITSATHGFATSITAVVAMSTADENLYYSLSGTDVIINSSNASSTATISVFIRGVA